MENNLYYTPEISEFYIGFEYEHLTGFEKEFKPWIYDLTSACNIIERESISHNGEIVKMFIPAIQACIEEKQCRVKYLDQEDIESLGWKSAGGYLNIKNFELSTGNAEKNTKENQWKLQLKEDNKIIIEQYRWMRFFGTIKNKSELIKLMQQLDIK